MDGSEAMRKSGCWDDLETLDGLDGCVIWDGLDGWDGLEGLEALSCLGGLEGVGALEPFDVLVDLFTAFDSFSG